MGGRYDPVDDGWQSTSPPGILAPRSEHTTVWTGDRMIVWGGTGGLALDDGAIYDPISDLWSPVSMADAPSARSRHTAVWTGSSTIVWGGNPLLNSGSRYARGQTIDGDGDGFSECDGDCNDDAAEIFPGAPQLCDGVNNDCQAPDWPTPPPDETDGDGDCVRICAGDCDDTEANTYPGASEVNDGLDNQCAGDDGFGIVDEISGVSSFFNPDDKNEFSWPAQAGATSYEVARSTVAGFSEACVTMVTLEPLWVDSERPGRGVVFYYLVRPFSPFVGSWGQDSTGAERTAICP